MKVVSEIENIRPPSLDLVSGPANCLLLSLGNLHTRFQVWRELRDDHQGTHGQSGQRTNSPAGDTLNSNICQPLIQTVIHTLIQCVTQRVTQTVIQRVIQTVIH
ncbi:hypothetical protein RRG08_048070 [Elysia crispata]|uniref:Uncharacterized protein n=1 Tax=Elysia crispata TaxID=231223 RepID=A0AAE0Z3M9_9GAST|nr:hypothetical protein RRG08_048070 [Elysia crispata]